MLRAKLAERAERVRQEEIARGKGEATDVNFGPQIRNYVLHPYKMVKDLRTGHEVGNVDAVLDGDLDEVVRAELLREAEGGTRGGPPISPSSRPRPTSTRWSPTASAARAAS